MDWARAAEQGASQQGALRVSQTRDIDEQAALLRGWGQTYAQMSFGGFRGAIAEVNLGDLYLFVEETSHALYQTGSPPPGVCAVGVPLRAEGEATFCGAPCSAQTVHVFSGRNGFDFQSPRGLSMAGVVIPEALLAQQFIGEECEAVIPTLGDAHLRRAASGAANELRQFLSAVFDVIEREPDMIRDEVRAERLARSVLSYVTQVLSSDGRSPDLHLAPGRRWHIVAEARELALDHPDRPITIAELCKTLGVSRRTLQYCFQDVVGHSPGEFLRIVRLNGARRAIKTSRSVTEAATDWGFWHLGRFSHDYRALFGEMPSETFRRSRARGPA